MPGRHPPHIAGSGEALLSARTAPRLAILLCAVLVAVLVSCADGPEAGDTTPIAEATVAAGDEPWRVPTAEGFGPRFPGFTPRAALGASPSAPSASKDGTPTVRAGRPQPPRPGGRATDFQLPDLSGNQVALSDFVGRSVMLTFWATWCGPCRLEMPFMVSMYQRYRSRGFEIVAVNLREDPQRVSRFVDEFGLPFAVVLDERGQLARDYYVRGIPTSVFIDKDGVIQAVHMGAMTETRLRRYVEELVR